MLITSIHKTAQQLPQNFPIGSVCCHYMKIFTIMRENLMSSELMNDSPYAAVSFPPRVRDEKLFLYLKVPRPEGS